MQLNGFKSTYLSLIIYSNHLSTDNPNAFNYCYLSTSDSDPPLLAPLRYYRVGNLLPCCWPIE